SLVGVRVRVRFAAQEARHLRGVGILARSAQRHLGVVRLGMETELSRSFPAGARLLQPGFSIGHRAHAVVRRSEDRGADLAMVRRYLGMGRNRLDAAVSPEQSPAAVRDGAGI